MLAVILVIVVGSIRLIGSNANNVFSHSTVSRSSRECSKHIGLGIRAGYAPE
jgi:hypothetical protein